MNNPLVDEIQALADCRSHAERADWLLTVPLSVLSHYEMTIRNRLQIAGFYEGVWYLEDELALLRAWRLDGRSQSKNFWTGELIALAAEAHLPATPAPTPVAASAPDHGLTDL
ncbi:MAG: hypothetical protein ACK4PN_08520 [Allorhizobium sp.]